MQSPLESPRAFRSPTRTEEEELQLYMEQQCGVIAKEDQARDSTTHLIVQTEAEAPALSPRARELDRQSAALQVRPTLAH
jgi:hypothetical protein